MKEIKLELGDAEELDKFIRAWINRMHANDEIELGKLYDTIDSKISNYQTSSNKRKRRRTINKVAKHYVINNLRFDNQNQFYALLGSIASVVIMIYQLFDCHFNYKWDNCFYAALFFIALIVWLKLDKVLGENRQCQKVLQIVNNEIPSIAFMLNMIFYFVQWYFDMSLGLYNVWFYIIETVFIVLFLMGLVWICSSKYSEIYGEMKAPS